MYTFISKWTVLIMTIVTFALAIWGYTLTFSKIQFTTAGQTFTLGNSQHPGWGILVFLAGVVLYFLAWLIAFSDSIQEHKYGWTVGLFVLLPFWVGPLLYGLLGPRNTR